jgi:DNA-binding NtrC family response regulator
MSSSIRSKVSLPTARQADAPPAEPPVTGARVLIVDDDEGIRTMFEEFITAKGHRARSVTDGAAALRAVGSDTFDLMLLDIEMPGLSGVDALVALRAVAPELVVIMVSGTASQDLARRALDNGAFDFVVKPVDLPRLAEVIETALLLKGREMR